MKKILIIADGILAKNFLGRLIASKSNSHHYVIVVQDKNLIDTRTNFENFNFYHFDPTSFSKLKSVADGYFSQFCIITQNKADALASYENLRKISTKTEIVFMNIWEQELLQNEIFSADKHLSIVDVRDIAASRLMDYLPDVPVLADNIGLSEGEIMEVKVPIGSSYMYRHVNSIQQKKWRIALIYRSSEIILPKPSVMIHPNDTLLIVGDPNVLQNVYRSIKRESGQFPSPFGSNIYAIIDMRIMDDKRISRLIDDSLFLNSKLNNKRLIFKILNPTLGKNLDKLKSIKDKNILVLMDYFSTDNSSLKTEINRSDIGLLVSDDKYFFKFQKFFYELKIPILKTGKISLQQIKQGVILGEQGQEIENQSSVIMDCCTQLGIDMKFYYFDSKNTENDELSEHFDV
ncbi:MAG: potassium transporter TrkA, partial [Campylobacter sp.]|nr:potassium transporter TrkA [Campylobacter sp.]